MYCKFSTTRFDTDEVTCTRTSM
eukprot:SAG11_NODE_21151_length_431_cov_0.762048_1_plen_22_part_01